jgi:hypothetical protein
MQNNVTINILSLQHSENSEIYVEIEVITAVVLHP